MGKKYLEIKENSLESSVFNILHGIQEEKEVVAETNKNDKSDDGDGMDAVQPKAVKKKFANRKDKDIDNDGDVDSSDKYLHKRRKAVSKAITKKEGNAFGMALKSAKDKGEKTFVVSGKTYSVKEEVELEEGTSAVPTSMADFRAIMNIMKRPIKAKDAEKAISKYINDDYLANGIISIKEKDPNADARPAIMKGFNALEIRTKGEPSYGTIIKFNRKFEIADKRQKMYLDRSPSEDSNDMKTITLRGGSKVRAEEVEIDEGKMAQMHQMMKDKKSAAQIAKEMGLDVKTVKALMDGYNKMVPESFEIGTEKYLKHTVNVTPGQKEWTETVTKKAASMRETLAKMWGVDEGKNVFEKDAKKDLTSEVKGGTTMTGKKVADIDTKPTIKEKKK
jgi:hypothetical protein